MRRGLRMHKANRSGFWGVHQFGVPAGAAVTYSWALFPTTNSTDYCASTALAFEHRGRFGVRSLAAFWPSRTHRDLLRLYLCSNVYVTIVFCCWMVGHRRLHQRGARRDRPTPHRARPGLIYPVRLCVGMADGEAPHAAARSRDQVGRPLRTPRRDGRRPVARQRRVLRPNALPARCLLGQYLRGVPPSEVARPRDLMPRAVRDGAQSMPADAGQRHTACTSSYMCTAIQLDSWLSRL